MSSPRPLLRANPLRVAETRALAATTSRPLSVSALGFGAAGLGNLYHAVDDATATQTVQTALDAGVRYFDTAPFYGLGLSETRLGRALGAIPVTLSTKVGRVLDDDPHAPQNADVFIDTPKKVVRFDYSYDGVMASHRASLQRLSRQPDIILVHDLDVQTHGADDAARHMRDLFDGGGMRALQDLKQAGEIAAIGAGTNGFQGCEDLMRHGDFDCFMVAGRYTLLEQSALNDTLPKLATAGIGVLLGGPFNSGILATGAVPGAKYNYQDAPPDIMSRVRALQSVCADHGVSLAAAALQFPAAHPVIKSVVCGAQTADQMRMNRDGFEAAIPPGFWRDIAAAGLVHQDAPLPQSGQR